MERIPKSQEEKQQEIDKMREVVVEAYNRMVAPYNPDKGDTHTSRIIEMTFIESEIDLPGLEVYLRQYGPDLTEEEKFYLNAKIHLLKLQRS